MVRFHPRPPLLTPGPPAISPSTCSLLRDGGCSVLDRIATSLQHRGITLVLLAIAATLIGVFATKDGIVVAADTATSVLGTGVTRIERKVHPCGSRAVATLNGRLVALDGAAYEGLVRACASLDSSDPLDRQAARLAIGLAAYASELLPMGSDGFLQTVIFAGYDETKTPAVFVAQVRWTGTQFEATVPVRRRDCVTLSGEVAVAEALRMRRQPRLFARYFDRREVAAVASSARSRAGCLELGETEAKSFFLLAVSVTREVASDLDIPPDMVNWPVDFTVIRPGGAVDPIRRVEELSTDRLTP